MGNAFKTTAATQVKFKRQVEKIRRVKPVPDSSPRDEADPDSILLDPVTDRQTNRHKHGDKTDPFSTRKTKHSEKSNQFTRKQEDNKFNPLTSRKAYKVEESVDQFTAHQTKTGENKHPVIGIEPELTDRFNTEVTNRKRDDIYCGRIPYYVNSEVESARQLYPHNSKWLQYDIAREPVIGGTGQGYRILRRDWNSGSYEYVTTNCRRDLTDGRWELDRSVCAKLREDTYCPYLTDVTVIDTEWGSAIVVGDHLNKSVKCFFYKSDQYRHSCYHLTGFPKGVTRSSLGGVVVAIPDEKKLLFLNVTPELKYAYHVTTQIKYHYLAGITETKLAASAPWERVPTVDVVDVLGHVIFSVSAEGPIFSRPTYLTVTPNKELIVIDKCYTMINGEMTSCMKLICVSMSGKVRWTYPFEDTGYAGQGHEVKHPAGVSCDRDCNVFVADYRRHKIVQLTSSGRFVAEIITEDDDLNCPDGVHYDYNKHRLFVAERRGQIKVFNLAWQNI